MQPSAPELIDLEIGDEQPGDDQPVAPDMYAWRLREIEHKVGQWSAPNVWHTDRDPANIRGQLDAVFNDLGRPTYAVKVGVLHGKYEMAKNCGYGPILHMLC